ncbi:hypothetical protein DNU06_02145 [Putridiphycobacter roseus]|uniref:Spore protein YkvP/CgeB glycosyl transferase-like domain-containing protein n=1 Tax=Putridiphycobacter roseus TaxID=2219161 RepID=A0A2W1NSM6_9FLAO|nr:glycosyltransferase [Putridiphycobacter roseus]PZE18652.1 hypothetical protein DNU06_02145 [Putridiphycobacter roseus]
MKIAFFTKYNDGYLNQLMEKKSAQLTDYSYDEIITLIEDDFYYMYGSYMHYFKSLGHEAILVVPNFQVLLDKWCLENKVALKSPIDICIQQIQQFEPDIVYLNSNFEYFSKIIPAIKPYTKAICAWISCPLPNDFTGKGIDHIFTLFQPHHQLFKEKGIESTLVSGHFDNRILSKVSGNKIHPLTFIGGIGGFHKKREEALIQLSEKTDLKIWGYGYKSNNKLKHFLKSAKRKFKLQKEFQGEAWGIDMYQILHQSSITFNYHGDIVDSNALNLRVFEATGAGSLLLTENYPQIKLFFEPGKEVVCYDSIEDAIQKIDYYHKHPKEAEAIAKAGQKRTLENYNNKDMVLSMIPIFEKLIANEK